MPSAHDILAAAGIHMLAVPTPFAIGPVNVYLIEGTPLTLVDTGPNSATSLTRLERLLAERGHRLEELEQLIVTHQHLDHLGLTGLVAERSGAEVAFLGVAAHTLSEFQREAIANDEYQARLMLAHGLDEHVTDALRSVGGILRAFGAPASVSRPLQDGGRLRLGDREMTVLWRPGHSPSDTVFHDAEARIAIVGDHLLSHVSSNAVVTRPLDGREDGPRPHPLLDYRASLQATHRLELDLVLPGHGPPIDDHRKLIEQRLDEQDRRAERILEVLAKGRQSAHEIATELFGGVAFTQAFLTLSEVLGHLDLLIERGQAVEDRSGPVASFVATGA
jgi:glyoxylase-like metal-dependent hydrolase (beta-lactamase superfamily II)